MTFIKILSTHFLFIFVILTNAKNVHSQSTTTGEQNAFFTVSSNSSSSTVPSLLRCPPGEELRICSFCDGTCRFPVPFCGFFCSLVPRCFCQLGRLRNGHGQCIPRDQCFAGQNPPESYCCGKGRCLHCAIGYNCVLLQSGMPYCQAHWYGIGLMNYDDEIYEE